MPRSSSDERGGEGLFAFLGGSARLPGAGDGRAARHVVLGGEFGAALPTALGESVLAVDAAGRRAVVLAVPVAAAFHGVLAHDTNPYFGHTA